MFPVPPYFESFITTEQHPDNLIGHLLSQDQFDESFISLSQIDNNEFGVKNEVRGGARVYGHGQCIKNYTMFSVRVNGDVALCVSDDHIIGNIRKKTLDKILNSNNKLIRDVYKIGCKCSQVTSCKR